MTKKEIELTKDFLIWCRQNKIQHVQLGNNTFVFNPLAFMETVPELQQDAELPEEQNSKLETEAENLLFYSSQA